MSTVDDFGLDRKLADFLKMPSENLGQLSTMTCVTQSTLARQTMAGRQSTTQTCRKMTMTRRRRKRTMQTTVTVIPKELQGIH